MNYDFGFSDEFAANALKEDARDSSLQYSKIGLDAFLSQKRAGPAAKPNTRFLRNILLETDSHNAALLAKEREETQTRHDHSKRTSRRERTATSHGCASRSDGSRTKRRRIERDGDEIGHDAPEKLSLGMSASYGGRAAPAQARSSTSGHEERSSRRPHTEVKHRSTPEKRRRKHSREPFEEAPSERRRSKHHHKSRNYTEPSCRDDAKAGEKGRKTHRHHQSGRSTSSSDTGSSDTVRKTPHLRRSKHKPTIPEYSMSPERRHQENLRKHWQIDEIEDALSPKRNGHDQPSEKMDSDPLDDIIGPNPPQKAQKPRLRGRGKFEEGSGAIDSHFSSAYDPKADVKPDSNASDDWDQALEALKDRQHWQRQGAERLRSAGFSENEIRKWEKGGQKDEEDVQWKSVSEGREWDRGKVVSIDGHVELKPNWDRLKSSQV